MAPSFYDLIDTEGNSEGNSKLASTRSHGIYDVNLYLSHVEVNCFMRCHSRLTVHVD